MKRLAVALWVFVAPFAVWVAPPDLLVDLGAGGGYDDNLNNATSANQREGSAFGTSWLMVGASIPVSERVGLGISGMYNGTYYADFDDLTFSGLAVRSSGRLSVRDSTSLTIGAGAGRRWYGDDARNATVYDGALGVRERVTPRLAMTAGYRYANQAAEEATFNSRSNRVAIGGEFAPIAGAWIGLGYAVEVGQSPFYQAASVPIPSGGRGRRPSTTFGANQVVFRDDTTTRTLSANWEQEAFESVFVRIEYAHAFISADAGDARDNLVWASVAYRN